jgi:ABC-type multidrug transport system fused ATPase/permease subunit
MERARKFAGAVVRPLQMQTLRIQNRSLLASLLTERLGWRALILLLSLLAAVFGLLAPYAQKRFTDALVAGQPAQGWIVFAFACLVAYHALWQLNTWLATREGLISQKALGDGAFRRLLEGPGGLVGRAPAGVAVSLFAVDIPGASALLDQSLLMFSSLFFPLLLTPFVLDALFGIPWWTSVGAITVLALVQLLLARLQSGYFLAFKQLAAERTGLVSEWVQNIRTLRILGWTEAAERRIFALRRRETVNRKRMVTNGQVMNSIATSATFTLNVLAMMLLLRLRRAAGTEPTPGELLSLLWILGVFLARPLRQMPWMLVMVFDSFSSLERLEKAFAIPVTRPSLSRRAGASAGDGEEPYALDVRGLTLESEERCLLRNVDLRVKEGSLVAVVGEVGSGKSVLLHSLVGGTGARFDRFAVHGEASSGPLDPKVRGRFAFVPQEGFTVSATLRENVLFTYLDGQASPAGVDERVARSLAVSQFLPGRERVSHGLDSEIGERGVNLSGGQRQRVGLARAHFADRAVILLDDCLSAVDVDTERRLVNELILGAWRGRTRILATHRLAVLPHCDEVIFLHEGEIEERGRYEELLARSGRFREFVRREESAPPPPSPSVPPPDALPGGASEGEEAP